MGCAQHWRSGKNKRGLKLDEGGYKDGAQAGFGAVVLAVGHRYLPPVLDCELLPSILRKDSVSPRHSSAVSCMGRIPQIRGLAVVREYRRSRHILLSLSRHRIPGDTR